MLSKWPKLSTVVCGSKGIDLFLALTAGRPCTSPLAFLGHRLLICKAGGGGGVFYGIIYRRCQLWHLTLLSNLSPEQSGISLTWKGNSSPLQIKHLLIFFLWQRGMRQLFLLLQTQAKGKKKQS